MFDTSIPEGKTCRALFYDYLLIYFLNDAVFIVFANALLLKASLWYLQCNCVILADNNIDQQNQETYYLYCEK